MNEILYSFDRILYKGIGSWLKELNGSIGYEQLLRELGAECYGVQLLNSMEFPKGVEAKKAYFALLIENEGKRFLDVLQQEIHAAFNECERSFLVHEALTLLEQKLERTALLINGQGLKVELTCDESLRHDVVVLDAVPGYSSYERSYARSLPSISYPGYARSRFTADKRGRDMDYVLQLIKSQLSRLYLEVQDQYKVHLKRNVMSLEDIHWSFFGEAVPEEAFVVTNDRDAIEGIKVDEEGALGEIMVDEGGGVYEAKRFEPLMDDTRPLVKSVLAYADIVANRSKFAQLEVELFGNELLDTDYRFRRKPHGNVMKMAAVYWVAFKKGYFQKYYFKEKRKVAVTANDVRVFLNYRYGTNIERQFQNFRDEDMLNAYLEREVWISFIDR